MYLKKLYFNFDSWIAKCQMCFDRPRLDFILEIEIIFTYHVAYNAFIILDETWVLYTIYVATNGDL